MSKCVHFGKLSSFSCTKTQNTRHSSKHTHTHTLFWKYMHSHIKLLHAVMMLDTHTNTHTDMCLCKFKSIHMRTKAWHGYKQEGIHKHYMSMHYADTCTHPSSNRHSNTHVHPIYLIHRGKTTHHFTPSLSFSLSLVPKSMAYDLLWDR